MAVPAIGVTVFLGVVGYLAYDALRTEYTWRGPTSDEGFQAIVNVNDAGVGIAPNYWCDVVVLDRDGSTIVKWRDPNGQQSSSAASDLLRSMKWRTPSDLEFVAIVGPLTWVRIDINVSDKSRPAIVENRD